ncbi:hypothetical protein [Anditalea andensis]|nr:hypothetical protein [Anditalea andensis]
MKSSLPYGNPYEENLTERDDYRPCEVFPNKFRTGYPNLRYGTRSGL